MPSLSRLLFGWSMLVYVDSQISGLRKLKLLTNLSLRSYRTLMSFRTFIIFQLKPHFLKHVSGKLTHFSPEGDTFFDNFLILFNTFLIGLKFRNFETRVYLWHKERKRKLLEELPAFRYSQIFQKGFGCTYKSLYLSGYLITGIWSGLTERAIFWIFCQSREAASGAVLEIFLVNIKSRKAAPEPFWLETGVVRSRFQTLAISASMKNPFCEHRTWSLFKYLKICTVVKLN